jgi:hypothetical protein
MSNILLQNPELPMPEGATPDVWNNYLPVLREAVKLIEEQNIDLSVTNDQFCYFRAVYRDCSFKIDMRNLFPVSIMELKSFLRVFDEIIDRILLNARYCTFSTRFYSDVELELRKYKNFGSRFLMYSIVADIYRNKGIRLIS